jgi:predicted MFS family arabinose efflux permease
VLIRTPEPPPAPKTADRNLRNEIVEGLRWVFGSPLLRSMQMSSMSFIGANAVWTSVYVLVLSRELGLSAVAIGLVFAAGGPGALVGSLAAGRLAERLGPGRPVLASYWLSGLATLAVPLAAALPDVAVPLLMASSFVSSAVIAAGSVAELSVRQAVTPDRLQGRTNTTMRSLNWGMVTVGSTVGGLLGERIGLDATLLVGALLATASSLPVTLSPVRRLRTLPPAPALG